MTVEFNHNEVRDALKNLNRTQEDLARGLEVTVGTVNRWLTGKCKPLKVYQKMIKEVLDEFREHAA